MSLADKLSGVAAEIQALVDAARQRADEAHTRLDSLTIPPDLTIELRHEQERRLFGDAQNAAALDALRLATAAADNDLNSKIAALQSQIAALDMRLTALESQPVPVPEPDPVPQTIVTATDATGCAGYAVHFGGLIPGPKADEGFATDVERRDYCRRVGLVYDSSQPGQGVLRVAPQIAALNPRPSTLSLWSVNAMIALGAGTPCIVRASDPEAQQVKVLKTASGLNVGMANYTAQGPAILDVRDGTTRSLAIDCLRRRLGEIDKTGLTGLMVDNCTVFPSRVTGLFTAAPVDYGTTAADKDTFDAAWAEGMRELVRAIDFVVWETFGSKGELIINPGRTALAQGRFIPWMADLPTRIGLLVEHFDQVTGATANALIETCRSLKNPLVFVGRSRMATTAEWQTNAQAWKDCAAFAVMAAGGREIDGKMIPYWISLCPQSLTTRLLSTAYTPCDAMLRSIAALGPMRSNGIAGSNVFEHVGETGRVSLNVMTREATWSA